MRRFILTLTALVCACGPTTPPGESSGSDSGPRDLLLITVDTLRPDFLEAYGHPRPTAPAIAELAADGIVFEQHFATVPQTAPSHASLFTGLSAREHGVRKNGMVLSADLPVLPELLRDSGYRTEAVIAFEVLDSRFGFERGFDHFDDAIEPDEDHSRGQNSARQRTYERYADRVVDRALERLAAAGDEPLFLWVHLFDPHDPYCAPEPEGFDGAEAARLFDSRAEVGEVFTRETLIKRQSRYEWEVIFAFKELERLIEAWDARRTPDRTVVAFTADHGEGLGEHDLMGHGLYLYEEQIHVPFVLRATGAIEAGRRIERPTSAVDVAATLPALLGLELQLPGRDLLAADFDSESIIVTERPLYEEDDLMRSPKRRALLELKAGREGGSRGMQIALRRGRWKFVWSDDMPPELYDLTTDPAESANLASAEPETLVQFEGLLEDWLATRRDVQAADTRRESEVNEMLEALGY